MLSCLSLCGHVVGFCCCDVGVGWSVFFAVVSVCSGHVRVLFFGVFLFFFFIVVMLFMVLWHCWWWWDNVLLFYCGGGSGHVGVVVVMSG